MRCKRDIVGKWISAMDKPADPLFRISAFDWLLIIIIIITLLDDTITENSVVSIVYM